MPNLLTQRRILRPFRPDQISGLALWLDAADAASITLDGSNNVSQWNDKSGNGRHATQTTLSLRPPYVANAVNGLPVVRTTGTNVFLQSPLLSPSAWYGPDGQTVTSVVLMRRFSTGRFAWGIGANALFGGSDRFACDRQAVADFAVMNSSGYLGISTPPELPTELASDATQWQSGGKLRIRRYINGSPSEYESSTTLGGSMTADQRVFIGTNAVPAPFDFCEVMVWPRILEASELSRLESYLASKWGGF